MNPQPCVVVTGPAGLTRSRMGRYATLRARHDWNGGELLLWATWVVGR